MSKTIHGIMHGKTIELDDDFGMDEGQTVAVQLDVIPTSSGKTGAGFLRTEGALADDEEWDEIMAQIYIARIGGLRRQPRNREEI